MIPATTVVKNFEESKYVASKPAVKVVHAPRQSFAAKLDAGINWFSRNLTGQIRPVAGAVSETEA